MRYAFLLASPGPRMVGGLYALLLVDKQMFGYNIL